MEAPLSREELSVVETVLVLDVALPLGRVSKQLSFCFGILCRTSDEGI